MRCSTVVKRKGMEWVKKGGSSVYTGRTRKNIQGRGIISKEKTLYRNNLSRVIYFQRERSRYWMEEIRRTGKKKS